MNIDDITPFFVDKILDAIYKKSPSGPRTFGFEYEFLPRVELTPKDMYRLYDFLPQLGFMGENARFESSSGMYITFEPGGQIEYHSPPVMERDMTGFIRANDLIRTTNRAIMDELGIEYVPTGYIADRTDAPLCLETERYMELSARLKKSGTRGLEMMKGTGSIHLHVLIKSPEELSRLFFKVCGIALMEDFLMGRERRDIWNRTDTSRCGLPFYSPLDENGHEHILEDYVRFTLAAYDIHAKCPYHNSPGVSADSFFRHMTTIFTDVRLNLRGPTIELRTLDSMPPMYFELKWKKFVSMFENTT